MNFPHATRALLDERYTTAPSDIADTAVSPAPYAANGPLRPSTSSAT
ncbi:hypothetical protein [Streptomyces phaeochromogenes]